MDSTRLVLPTITIGGTTKDSLVNDLCAARAALLEVTEKMGSVAPHGRDYPDPAAFQAARSQHAGRCAKLKDVLNDFNDILDGICEMEG